jgi:hypothetical protein
VMPSNWRADCALACAWSMETADWQHAAGNAGTRKHPAHELRDLCNASFSCKAKPTSSPSSAQATGSASWAASLVWKYGRATSARLLIGARLLRPRSPPWMGAWKRSTPS